MIYKNHTIEEEDGLFYYDCEGYDTLKEAQDYIDKYVVPNEIYDEPDEDDGEEQRAFDYRYKKVKL
jgi:hypothetical protein